MERSRHSLVRPSPASAAATSRFAACGVDPQSVSAPALWNYRHKRAPPPASVTPSLSPSRRATKRRCLPETLPANNLNPQSNLMRQVGLRRRRLQQYGAPPQGSRPRTVLPRELRLSPRYQEDPTRDSGDLPSVGKPSWDLSRDHSQNGSTKSSSMAKPGVSLPKSSRPWLTNGGDLRAVQAFVFCVVLTPLRSLEFVSRPGCAPSAGGMLRPGLDRLSHHQERGISSKVNLYDESLLLNNTEYKFLEPMLKQLWSRGEAVPLLNLCYLDWTTVFTTAACNSWFGRFGLSVLFQSTARCTKFSPPFAT